jgi:hypothetical protein
MLNGNQTELARKEANLIAVVEKILPDFAGACRAHDTPVVIMHQDAFAADYQEEEYRLIGLAIKFAGICGKEAASSERTGRVWMKTRLPTERCDRVCPACGNSSVPVPLIDLAGCGNTRKTVHFSRVGNARKQSTLLLAFLGLSCAAQGRTQQ